MFCILSLLVFSLLGLFSATHRPLAKEALSCVFRRITLRPCNTGFKEKVKSRLIGKLAARSPFMARVFNRYEEVFSWLFFLLIVWSTVWSIRGGVNFYLYGSCNGLNSTGFCLFDPSGGNSKVTEVQPQVCTTKPVTDRTVDISPLTLSDFPHKTPAGAKDQLVFIGCYTCDYTRKAYPQIEQILKLKPINYTFIHFPAKPETEYLTPYVVCANQLDPAKFWNFNDSIFASAVKDIDVPEYADGLVAKAGYDTAAFKQCLADPAIAESVKKQKDEVIATGLYGTPTIAINKEVFVGPKPDRVYKRALKGFVW